MWAGTGRLPWSALCGPDDKAWYGQVIGRVKVRDIPNMVNCPRCIRIAGFEGRKRVPIKIDFEGSGSGGFEALPADTYDATVSKVTYHAKTATSRGPYLEFEFTLEQPKGRRMWRNESLLPEALWHLKQTLTRLGQEVPDGEFDLEPEEIVGTKCRITLEVKPHYQGGTNEDGSPRMDNDVVDILPAGDSGSFGWGS